MKPITSQREPDLRLEAFLPYRLSVLSNRISQAIAQGYEARFALAIPEWRVLAVLARHPGISAMRLGELTAMDKVAVSRALAALLRRKLIQRHWARDDRRRSELSLLPAGASIYDAVAAQALQREAELLSVLDSSERAALLSALSKLESGGLQALRAMDLG